MPHGFDNSWGIVKDLGLASSVFFFYFLLCLFVKYLTLSIPLSASVRSRIIDEKKAFIRQVLEIPFKERKCRDLIILDTLHAYYGGPEPTPTASRLNRYSCRHKSFLSYFFLSIVSLSSLYLTPVLCPLQKWRQPVRKHW